MRKLLTGIPLVLLVATGCNDGRRDFTYCDTVYQRCNYGFTCDLNAGLCVPDTADAALPTNPDTKDGNGLDETPSGDLRAPDAPMLYDVQPDDPSVETPPVDTYQAVDLPPTDVYIPDAPGTCTSDNHCVGVPGGPYCVKNTCVACKTSSQCDNDAGVPLCSTANACVSCAAVSSPDGGSACPASSPVCQATSGRCVQCLGNSDCPTAGQGFCSAQNLCVGCNQMPIVNMDGGAPDGGVSSVCSGATPVCANTGTVAGQCVQCVANTDCSGATPVCTSTNTCVLCTSDSQCTSGPGVCMFEQTGTFPQDGRCASDAETLYVQNAATCGVGADAGTAAKPFCQVQAAIDAISASQRVVVITGPTVLGAWAASPSAAAAPIYVIGRKASDGSAPVISAAATDIGIRIVSGKVYIRGLTVRGAGATALSPGIVVDAGAVLGLDRSTVSGHAGGLIVHNGAGFDIANSIFVENQSGVGDYATFGGVSLGSLGTGMVGRFWFNTVANNQAPGVVCTTNTQSIDGALLWLNTSGDQSHCTLATTSKSGANDVRNPQFSTTSPYHLTLSSPCKDFIDGAVPHPSYDFDGQVRPRGLKLDCGADELY